MPGCGGLRKIRYADPQRGKGKRGGLRIIYLFIPNVTGFSYLIFTVKMKKTILPLTRKRYWLDWQPVSKKQ